MRTIINHNDLELFLTKEDRQQIKDMPEPSRQQAEMVIQKWNDYFGEKEVKETPEAFNTGKIWIKTYIKARDCYPELFI